MLLPDNYDYPLDLTQNLFVVCSAASESNAKYRTETLVNYFLPNGSTFGRVIKATEALPEIEAVLLARDRLIAYLCRVYFTPLDVDEQSDVRFEALSEIVAEVLTGARASELGADVTIGGDELALLGTLISGETYVKGLGFYDLDDFTPAPEKWRERMGSNFVDREWLVEFVIPETFSFY